jgi:putative redox protein
MYINYKRTGRKLMNKVELNFKGIIRNDKSDGNSNSNSSNEDFSGELKTENGNLRIGMSEGEFLPYQMFMGALGSCLYSTFLDIVKKMRLEFSSCSLDIQWEKRTETPTTCKFVMIKARLVGIDMNKQARFHKAFELATEYCSIYSTLSHVAEMHWELSFE